MSGHILNIQRFCTHDGPGIRTTVFLKGCPLRCLWCHNPESQLERPELLYDAKKCVNCLRCVNQCAEGCHKVADGKHVLDRTACLSCGACLSPLCSALEIAGETASASDILTEVLKDRAFYVHSGGGLTLSGGEPLYQLELCVELLKGAKENGLHTAVETCGLASREALGKVAPLVDIFLFDFKETDPQRHLEYTGVDNRLILENLKYLDTNEKNIILRCPIIPSLNDREDHIRGIARLANGMKHLAEIVIEPYHTLGVGKYERLGRAYTLGELPAMDGESVNDLIDKLRQLTAIPVKKA